MLYSLLVLILAGPTLWRFPQEADAARAAAREALADEAKGHLLDDAALDKHLAARAPPKALGCLADQGACADLQAAAVDLLGLSAEMIVELEVGPKRSKATLRLKRAGRKDKQWRGQGADAAAAVAAAVRAYRGQGFLVFDVTPDSARLEIDGASAGEGSGRHPLSPGVHKLRVSAEGHRTVETEAKIVARQALRLKVDLHRLAGELILKITPASASIFIDEMPISAPSEPISLTPGVHALRCEAEGYDTLKREVTIRDKTQTRLSLPMIHSEPVWRRALRTTHPDTRAHDYYVRGGLGFTTVDDGDVNGGAGRGEARVNVERQLDNVGLLGGEVALGWRWGEYWLVEPLSVHFGGGGDAVDAWLEGDEAPPEGEEAPERAQMESLSRLMLRARAGARYSRWRLSPYALLGLGYAMDEFALTLPSGDSTTVSQRLWHLNAEVGARYQHDEALFISGALSVDLGARMATTFFLGAGWALDLPESL